MIRMDMSYKGWLSVALKVLGVVTLVNGMVLAVAQLGSLPSIPASVSPWMTVSCIAMPLIMLGAGLYLLLGTQRLVTRIWADQENQLDAERAIFKVAMKVLGMALVVQALPKAVQIISNALFIYGVGSVWDISTQLQFICQEFLSTLLKLLLGCYLLFKGTWLQRVVFPAENEQ